MANVDNERLVQLVNRFKAYKSPTDAQKLIILLGEKSNRTDDDNKKLAVLLRAEKKAEQLTKARKASKDVLEKIKNDEKKLETRRKIIWGSALKTAAKNDPQVAQVMSKLFNGGYISDRDKDAVRKDLNASNNTLF
jgi:RPA family protein